MAKITIYKVAALVYDVYCKSFDTSEKITFDSLEKYHKAGSQFFQAMNELDLLDKKNGRIIWKGPAPTFELIEKIEKKRAEIMFSHNHSNKKKQLKQKAEPDQITMDFTDPNLVIQNAVKQLESKFQQRFDHIASLLLNQFNNSKEINAKQ